MNEDKDRGLHEESLQNPLEFTQLVARIIKDCVLLLLIGTSVFFLMAIIGYDVKDPGWSHLAYHPVVSNWTGVIGALLADIAFSFIGLSAWITPIIVAFPCIRLLKRKKISLIESLPFVMLRFIGALIFVFAGCALLSLHLSNTTMNYPFTTGGIIGQAFSEWMVSWFSIQGSSVLLWFGTAIGLTLFIEIAWRDLIIGVGGGLLFCFNTLVNKFSSRASPDSSLSSSTGLEEHNLPINERLAKEVEPVKENVNFADELKDTVESSSLNIGETNHQESESSGLLGISATHTAALDVNNQSEKGVFNRLTGGLFTPKNTLVVTDSKMVKSDVQKESSQEERLDSSAKVLSPTLSELKYRELSSQKNILKKAPTIQGSTNSIEEVITPFKSENKDDSTIAEDTPNDGVSLVENQSVIASVQGDLANAAQQTSNKAPPVIDNIESDGLKTELDVLKPKLKIVPLSETHQSTLEDESVFGQIGAPAKLLPIAQVPNVNLLDPPEQQTETGYTSQQLEDMSRLLEVKLKDFGVIVEVVEVNPGPVITRFEIQPAPGVKSSKIANLAKDLARSLAVMSVRVVEVIPGKSVMGIEIPNINRKMVRLSEVLTAPVYQEANSRLTLALGNDIAGNPVVANLAKMPHLLVAGTTGSGKSVGVNAMILSLLFKAGPQDVRLMLIDPKMLELSIYEGIPHLLTPVITDMKEAAGGLRWCVAEMERRYKLMSKMGVRNLDGFNDKVREGIKAGAPLLDPIWDPQEHGESPGTPAPQLETLPYIVVVIDEFADMMMIVGKKVEELIARIAQKARAAGIHLILATQRPSVDVITGLIKANVPTRIAFQVSSKIDSRTILDQGGSENLLGNGDMLFLPAGTSVPSRVHGAFVSDDEVHRTVEAWKKQGKPEFINIQLTEDNSSGANGALFEDDEQDALYDEAVGFITTTRKASISSVQRKFKIGYNRAARIVESMEAAGVISGAGTNGQREVIAPPPPPRN